MKLALEEKVYDRMPEGKTTAQRVFLLCTSMVLGGFGWFLMGQSEGAGQSQVSNAVAWVGGAAITAEDVHRLAAEDLRAVEAQRREILSSAVRLEVEKRLLVAEAESKGLTPEQILQIEIEDRLEPVSDDEIAAFRHEHADRLTTVTDEEVETVVREEILAKRRSEARSALFARLSNEHEVQIQSDWIAKVSQSTDPSNGPLETPAS